MASIGKLSLRPSTPRPPTSSDAALVDTLRSTARWIWIKEFDIFQPPFAPDLEQRAFRKVFTFSTSKGKPTSAKFVIGADDYFAFYLNGVMVQPTNSTHTYRDLVGFQIPLPIIRNTTTDTMTVAFRVVTLSGGAGLLVGAEITYESGETDTFFTGADESWIGERTFDEGWEQPWYSASRWAPARIYPPTIISPSDPNMNDLQSVGVFEQLPANATPVATAGGCTPVTTAGGCTLTTTAGGCAPVTTAGGQCTPVTTAGECAAVTGHGTSINMSQGAFVGVLLGSVLAAMVIGALASCFFTRKKARMAQKESDEIPPLPMPEPITLPGTPSTQQLRGVSSTPQPSDRYRSTPFSYVAQEGRNPDGASEPPSYTDSDRHISPVGPQPVRKGQSQSS